MCLGRRFRKLKIAAIIFVVVVCSIKIYKRYSKFPIVSVPFIIPDTYDIPVHESFDIQKAAINYNVNDLKRWTRTAIEEPVDGPGEMGTPVDLLDLQDFAQREMFKLNEFNLMASNMISLNRTLGDQRHRKCSELSYSPLLPDTSVIIVFHNEAWSTLMRTVWSVINRSPRALLKEIILVDDASDRVHLQKDLEDYLKTLPVPTFIHRFKKRSGLIRARLLGAKHAQGQVLTFLDSHCECTFGWLEPLLHQVFLNRKTVASPVIDIISDKTFEFQKVGAGTRGGYDWFIKFDWHLRPEKTLLDGAKSIDPAYHPYGTPTIAGGLFSIDKRFFYEVGSYDEGMEIWGGENLEMSFRIWMCHGSLVIVPCSRVGHVYRDNTPYSFPANDAATTIDRNHARTAEVWMDGWKTFFYAVNPGAKNVNVGDLSERFALKKRNKCQSFEWYLKKIYPESPIPKGTYMVTRVISQMNTNTRTPQLCLRFSEEPGDPLIAPCNYLDAYQVFVLMLHGQIGRNGYCLDGKNGFMSPVEMVACNDESQTQLWILNAEDKMIKLKKQNLCLTLNFQSDGKAELILQHCDLSLSNQKWSIADSF
ncbi:unnamed protein product [Trichogramma brassicae]|uniref:Polypeptide N-acetylgalactosaminyltransferase n=1 Tax=Trichogramma brassicae TaxID=86971 RepID=A0A6H5IHB5_9HYME|nr:unnamed protein product [Trichogramma brassicae]